MGETLAHKSKPLLCECNRLACITLDINDNYKIIIINGCMPNDNYKVNDVDAESDETVHYIEQIYAKMADHVNDVILVGDLKAELTSLLILVSGASCYLVLYHQVKQLLS